MIDYDRKFSYVTKVYFKGKLFKVTQKYLIISEKIAQKLLFFEHHAILFSNLMLNVSLCLKGFYQEATESL